MGVVYIIFALAVGLFAGIATYDAAGLFWAFVAYTLAGGAGVFTLALVRVIYAGRDESVPASAIRAGAAR